MFWSIFDSLLGQYRNTDKNIVPYPNLASFPVVWNDSYRYLDQDTWTVYRWDGPSATYVAISSSWWESVNKWAFATSAQLISTYPSWSAGWVAVVLETQTYWYRNTTSNNWLDTNISAIIEEASEQSVSWIRRLQTLLSWLAIKDSGGRVRVAVDTISGWTVTTVSTVTAVTTVTTLTNLTNFWLRSADYMQQNIARNAYSNSSRRHLSFS